MPIKAIVFDLGNVLIPFDYNRLLDKLNHISEGLGERFYSRYKENYNIHRLFEKNAITEEEFLNTMMQWTENKITKSEFCKIYSDLFEENKAVSSLLPQLKEKYKLVLLSNTNPIHQKYGWQKYAFLKHFNKLVLSHIAEAVKPEPKIYKAVEYFTGLPPEEHLFIDDIQEYVDGAINMGWNAVRFENASKLLSDFEKFGIEI